MKKVLAIDPGLSGAFVLTDGDSVFKSYSMPLVVTGKEKSISYTGALGILGDIEGRYGKVHVFLERALPMAMGSKHAFNYGRGFETLVIAIATRHLAYTMVEPSRWMKEMHQGISGDLKSKAKSLIAVERLYPQFMSVLPKRPKGGLHDGPIDALLIAGYGLRRFPDVIGDFY